MSVKVLHTRKQMLVFFMPGFLLGIAYINFFAKQSLTGTGVFGRHVLEQYYSAAFDVREYFFYVLGVRALPFIVLAAISFTSFGKIAAYLFLVWTGFTGGMLLSMAALEMGIQGCMFCAAGVLPQILFYVPAYVVLLWHCIMYPQNHWNQQKALFILAMMAVGIILEAFVNPILVKMVLKLGFDLV